MMDAIPPRRTLFETTEGRRLARIAEGAPWRRWGPYLSERQWGTVREDYSAGGTAWDYFPHDHARSRAYRWGEDGIAGWGDDHLRWCLGLALWNGRDPILKERMFGLTNAEGNHGEDVKELWYYQDGTPTHSYMRMLYKYPQAAFPYAQLVEENRRRGQGDPEFEIVDTGVFDEGRYFDVTVEYGKADVDDTLMCVTVVNRGPEEAVLHLLPQFWARNMWSWTTEIARARIRKVAEDVVETAHPLFPALRLYADGAPEILFCENETNFRRIFGMEASGYFKDGINDYVVHGERAAVNPEGVGSKCAMLHRLVLPPGGSARVRLRLRPAGAEGAPFVDFDRVFDDRRAEADEFYAVLQQDVADSGHRAVQRAAFAGMLWSKQFYYFNVSAWQTGDPTQPEPPRDRVNGRNAEWRHVDNYDVISMPDKWEFPWYASWDLAFHCITFALIDPDFAKAQLILLTREWYMHPNGQLPAYEWAFGDVNPPVHARAAWRVYQIDKAMTGKGDVAFLERIFHKLMLNFTWWVNRKDAGGRNIFQGGFLGLDNIGVFDRSRPLPTGGMLSQADGTSWMAMYTLNLLRIALELAHGDAVYEDIATKFFEHFLYIAYAMERVCGDGCGLWDPEDEFYYDVLDLSDARVPLRLRSMVGLIPLFAVEILRPGADVQLPDFTKRARWFVRHHPDLAALISRWQEPGKGAEYLLSLLRGHRLKALLRRALDEAEFLSDYGVRSLSKYHQAHPFVFTHRDQTYRVEYEPGESRSGVFGGNSNWRGPVWMPVNYLLIDSLYEFHRYYGDDFKVEFPVGSGHQASLAAVADDLRDRLAALYASAEDGGRPALGGSALLRRDPHFRDHLLFHEYYHGETGAGLGASHQTGWSGLIALLLFPRDPASPCGLAVAGTTISARDHGALSGGAQRGGH
ncbi:MGH1-like glycoside hydrolase domain-containing protein [Nguyenibacter sp. L1]|uniref:MGH1-like glycoside hydrolase domain-containing protein n=1 Tax=Nguyenibacter sp. L1 TaxID=3049350 RepID=UPI002B466DBE|nr:glucosidase [Nguyenibacter sp. L1]WRH87023.1 glucosidase [Nguyenibacter sp. L1]